MLSPFTHSSPGSLLHFPSSLISFLLLSFPLLSSFFPDIPSSLFVLLLISSAVVTSLLYLLSSPLFFLFFSFLHIFLSSILTLISHLSFLPSSCQLFLLLFCSPILSSPDLSSLFLPIIPPLLSSSPSLHVTGGSLAKQDWSIQWPTSESGKENNPACQPEPSQWIRLQLAQSPKVQSKYNQHQQLCHSPQGLAPALTPSSSSSGASAYQADRLTVDAHTGLFPSLDSGYRSLPPSPRQRHFAHTPPPLVVNASMTPPGTPPMRRRNKVMKAPVTPPPSGRKLIHLLPGFTALHRSKSHEFQLGNRIDDMQTPK